MVVSQATRSTYNLEAARKIINQSNAVVDIAKRLSMLGLASELYANEVFVVQKGLYALNKYEANRSPQENYLKTAAEVRSSLKEIIQERESLEDKIRETRALLNGNVKPGAQQTKQYHA